MNVKSSKARKQRKNFFECPLHEKRNSLAGHLSKDLRKKMGKRGISLRKGDTVKVMRGKHSGKEGKITGVDYKKRLVFIEKITRKKSDGTEIQVGIHASKILVLDLEGDEKRFAKKTASGKSQAKQEKGGI
ncbi:MAG: 50S ribosomal protein L24 [Candidatus ainarchaeum sp.]|nr:50S ribosomal protein L24 [Candidatus ainarchaeum sp.]